MRSQFMQINHYDFVEIMITKIAIITLFPFSRKREQAVDQQYAKQYDDKEVKEIYRQTQCKIVTKLKLIRVDASEQH